MIKTMASCILVKTNSFLLRMNRDDNWYFEKLTRDEAEKLLREEGEDGTFLIRDSSSSVGDYVLSILHEGEVVHYQIRRHGDDAFFSIEEHTAIHGLDTLVKHYQGDSNGLITRLTINCRGDAPPNDSLVHGKTNLLHRATEAGDVNVVSQMMVCGYKNRDAKNQDGQTAVHLASKSGKDEILMKLIQSCSSVNCRDTAGYTPLHYACQQNYSSTVKILVLDGGANVQIRHSVTGNVPMHEAAQRGHIECIQQLLSLNAPVNPRTVNNETPADLAKKNGHMDCYDLLTNFTPPIPRTTKAQWYHGTLSREEAVKILREYCINYAISNSDGLFLVRYSDRNNGAYVLTMLFENTPYNFLIRKEDNKLFIDDGPYLNSLEHLIEHYNIMSDGLPTCLSTPVAPTPKPPLPEFSTMPRIKKTSPHRTKQSPKQTGLSQRKGSLPVDQSTAPPIPPLPSDANKALDLMTKNWSFSADFTSPNKANSTLSDSMASLDMSSDLSNDSKLNNNLNTTFSKKDISHSRINLGSTLSLPPNSVDENINPTIEELYNVPKASEKVSSFENYNEIGIDITGQLSTTQDYISQNQLSYGSVLGEGEFGSVLKGIYMPSPGVSIPVAIKTLHTQHVETNRKEFLREARVMMGLNHICIVRLIGIVANPQLAMVQELAPLGSLLSFLLQHPDEARPMYELKLWACQVACGMRYLEEKRFVHRDLATRNILLANRNQAKISDFGLSRALSTDSSYYKASQGGKWPIKWYAPESYNFGTFSHKSDVWSFGVTLWEMYSYGKQPYGDKRGAEAIEIVESGKRLDRPENCPEQIYSVMLDCWAYNPQERPTFSHLVDVFSSHPEYMNISQLVMGEHKF